jgi:hypothetical protein
LDGQKVHPQIVDFWNEREFGKFKSETDRLPRNVFQFSTDHCIVTIRPSGTEPKIKLYIQLLPDGKPAEVRGLERFRRVRQQSERLSRVVYGELLHRAGLPRLDQAALLLPDIVAFERKEAYQKTTLPQLKEGLTSQRWAVLPEVHAWLRDQTALMTPGADPLPALKASLAHVLEEWSGQMEPGPLYSELRTWARS